MREFKFFQKEIKNESYALYYMRDNIPLDIVECGEIGTYREGFDAGVGNNRNCPYTDELRSEIWNRGYYTGNYANTLR
jgi:hypothetical protein